MRKITWIKLLLVVVSFTIGKGMLKIVSIFSGGRTSCIFDALGISCIGCNTLAAYEMLKRGQLDKAFALNPLLFVWITVLFVAILSELYTLIRRFIFKDAGARSIGDWFILKMFSGIKEDFNNVLPKMWKRNNR
jgi:hypothetical protein